MSIKPIKLDCQYEEDTPYVYLVRTRNMLTTETVIACIWSTKEQAEEYIENAKKKPQGYTYKIIQRRLYSQFEHQKNL